MNWKRTLKINVNSLGVHLYHPAQRTKTTTDPGQNLINIISTAVDHWPTYKRGECSVIVLEVITEHSL